MNFELQIDYPVSPNQAASDSPLAGYFETPEFAQARLDALGVLTGAQISGAPSTWSTQSDLGRAHDLIYQLTVTTDLPQLPDSAKKFLPAQIKAKVVEHWEALEPAVASDSENILESVSNFGSDRCRRGEIHFDFAGLPVKVQIQWRLRDGGGGRVQRLLSGQVDVKVPFIGKTVEEKIISGLLPRLKKIEEKLAMEWLERESAK